MFLDPDSALPLHESLYCKPDNGFFLNPQGMTFTDSKILYAAFEHVDGSEPRVLSFNAETTRVVWHASESSFLTRVATITPNAGADAANWPIFVGGVTARYDLTL